jgi:hypothetical protein
MITLKCIYKAGSVAFRAEMIEALPVAERRYTIKDGEVTLSGYPDIVLSHDAAELLAMPDGLYRMPTLHEQNQAAEVMRQAATAEEVAVEAQPPSSKKRVGG